MKYQDLTNVTYLKNLFFSLTCPNVQTPKISQINNILLFFFLIHYNEYEMCSFQEIEPFNNLLKDVKFGTDWVDLYNTLRALYNIFHNGLIHK